MSILFGVLRPSLPPPPRFSVHVIVTMLYNVVIWYTMNNKNIYYLLGLIDNTINSKYSLNAKTIFLYGALSFDCTEYRYGYKPDGN